MLSEDAETWGFNLVNMFWTLLTEGLKGALLDSGYKQPAYKQMPTKQSQKQALAILWAEAIKHYASQKHQETTMVAMVNALFNNRTNGIAKTLNTWLGKW